MGGEGSIQSMIVILRNNKKLLHKRNPFRRGSGFERLRDDYRKFSQGEIETKTVTKSQLREIRRKVIEENRKENIRIWVIGIVVSIFAVGFTMMGYKGIQNYEAELDEIKIKKSTDKYLFYIQDGDKWLEKGHHHNAVFQYLLAKRIYPNEYNVNYRLTLTYGSWCKYNRTGCAEGKRIYDNLKVQFPEKKELEELEKYFD
ncbi:hypothetical protein [Flagellimonas sp.]|uniref:hypothetical protein n=1 Tax=Flagellimonas sp. TaxID=2058762 RepID=UPI003F4A457C